jgi:hypothetical protein
MNVIQVLYLGACVVAGIVLAAMVPVAASRPDARGTGRFAAALVAVTLALLAVGVVSHTMLRHVIQVAPLAIALALVWRGSPYAISAGLPVLCFWLGIMASIWLFLLGVARIFSGRFTPIEVALTLIIGLAAGYGLLAAPRAAISPSLGRRIATAAVFSALQIVALVVSMLPSVASR